MTRIRRSVGLSGSKATESEMRREKMMKQKKEKESFAIVRVLSLGHMRRDLDWRVLE